MPTFNYTADEDGAEFELDASDDFALVDAINIMLAFSAGFKMTIEELVDALNEVSALVGIEEERPDDNSD